MVNIYQIQHKTNILIPTPSYKDNYMHASIFINMTRFVPVV